MLLVLHLAGDRIAGNINKWIDDQSGVFLISLRDFVNWSAHDTLGIAGILLGGTFVVLMLWSFFQKGESHDKEDKKPRPTESKPQVPVSLEFNPDMPQYFKNETRGNYDPVLGTDVYREYVCTVVNVSADVLTNVSWEAERVVWGKDRPNDHEYAPENLHEKLRYDLPSLSTKIDFNSHEREKLCLFSRLKKSTTDNEPIRIVHSSTAFHDRRRLMTVFIKVTANNYAEKHFSTEMWVHDGFLRMTGIRPESDHDF